MKTTSLVLVGSLLAATAFNVGCGTSFSSTAPTSQTAAAPSFAPLAGTYTSSQTVALTDSTPGSVVYFTTDGSTPTASSNVYSSPINVTANTTINAIATAAGYSSSGIASAQYVINPKPTAAPLIGLKAGTYYGPQLASISDSVVGASIYYTTDGSTPTTSSFPYTSPITINTSETLSAIAVGNGLVSSPVVSSAFIILPPYAATPAFSPLPGSYSGTQAVSITDGTAGAKIYYTTDGSTPTTTSSVYTAPVIVASTETINAMAVANTFTNSAVVSASYSIHTPTLSSPTFVPDPGSYPNGQSVSLSDANANATIYFTTDGSTPTTSSQIYNAPIAVSTSETITAIAVMSGYGTSAPVAAQYSIGATGGTYQFQNVQIVGGGFVDGILMHPAQQGLMYARTDVGGAYRWSTALNRWVPLLDFLTRTQSNLMGVESIALDPTNPNKLYLATGTYADSFGTNGAILISNDQGQTFTIVPLSFKLGSNDPGRFAGERLVVDPNLSSHLYLGTPLNGLWESLNSGATWAQSSTFPIQGLASANPQSTGGVVFEDFAPGTGIAGAITPNVYVGVDDATVPALYMTSDGGATWKPVAGQPTGLFLNRGVFGPDGNLYLSYGNNLGPENVSGGSIWRYTPPTTVSATGVWKNITPTPAFTFNPGTFGYGSVAVDPSHPGVIMATTLDLYYLHDDVFRSLDEGNSWIDLGENQIRNDSLSPWVSFGASSPGIGNWLVSVVIDPYDSNHVLYGNGQTIWQTTDATAADATVTTAGQTAVEGVAPTNWSVGALGLEETVIRTLISPPVGPHLLSGMRDIGGFAHTTLDASPATGMFTNPMITDTTGLDFAQAAPNMVVRVGDGGGTGSQFGAYSTNYGANWSPFVNLPGSLTGGGGVAISADGKTIVWAPEDSGVSYSVDFGATWQASSGAPPEQGVIADRINPKKFYIYNSVTGAVYVSIDGAATFKLAASDLPKLGLLRVSYAAEGDLWLASPSGLLHSTNSGGSFTQLTGPSAAYDVAFGAPAQSGNYPTIFLYGNLSGTDGVYRSTNSGNSWTSVTDSLHQYGYLNAIAADPSTFGRVYLGTSGRGIIYGDPNP